MSLFTSDTHFVVFMNAKGPKPSQELHSREALAPVFADLNKYDATTYFVGQNTIFTLSGQQSHGGSVFPSGTTEPEPSACVSTRRSAQDSLAVVLVCARDSRARLRSHPAARPLSLSNESLACPTGRTTPLHTRRYSPGVLRRYSGSALTRRASGPRVTGNPRFVQNPLPSGSGCHGYYEPDGKTRIPAETSRDEGC